MNVTEMKERHRMRAAHVVQTFKTSLGDDALHLISDDEFRDLELMIEEAISDELHNAAEVMEDIARQLRSISVVTELGI